jgi:hypothetical protein
VSPEQRPGQRQKLQNNSKTLLKGKERKSKRKHHKRKGNGLLPGGIEALNSLFKDQFINCKVGKIWTVLREGLRWLAVLINTALSHNMGHSERVLMVIFRSVIVCMRCDQYS